MTSKATTPPGAGSRTTTRAAATTRAATTKAVTRAAKANGGAGEDNGAGRRRRLRARRRRRRPGRRRSGPGRRRRRPGRRRRRSGRWRRRRRPGRPGLPERRQRQRERQRETETATPTATASTRTATTTTTAVATADRGVGKRRDLPSADSRVQDKGIPDATLLGLVRYAGAPIGCKCELIVSHGSRRTARSDRDDVRRRRRIVDAPIEFSRIPRRIGARSRDGGCHPMRTLPGTTASLDRQPLGLQSRWTIVVAGERPPRRRLRHVSDTVCGSRLTPVQRMPRRRGRAGPSRRAHASLHVAANSSCRLNRSSRLHRRPRPTSPS